MKNKIIRIENNQEGPCIVCGKKTLFVNYEKKNKEANSGFVCGECSIGNEPIMIQEEELQKYYCEECDITITNPAKGAGGIMFCSTPNCGAVVKKVD